MYEDIGYFWGKLGCWFGEKFIGSGFIVLVFGL